MTVFDEALAALDALPEETVAVDDGPVQQASDRDAAPYDLAAFARLVVPHVLGEPYIEGWFSRELCDTLHEFVEKLRAGKSPRLIIEVPPRHSKSIHEELLQAWLAIYVYNDRVFKMMVASASLKSAGPRVQNARKYVLAAIELGLAPGVSMSRETDGKFEWATNTGAESYAVGFKGAPVGRGAHLLIVDDPVKSSDEALSPAIREKTWVRYCADFRTRLAKGGGIIVIQTRWHLDDLTGRLLDKHAHENWTRITYEAIATDDELHRLEGEALFPELMPLAELLVQKEGNTDYWWLCLFQQSPIAQGGGIWRREWWMFHTPGPPTEEQLAKGYRQTPTDFDHILIAVDLSMGSKSEKASYACIETWGRLGPDIFLLEQRRKRWGFVESREQILEAYESAQARGCRVITIVEAKALGIDVLRSLADVIPGLRPDPAKGTKENRAHAAAPPIKQGRVFLPMPHESGKCWVSGFITEGATFPAAANDDQVDAAGIAIRTLVAKRSLWSQMPA